MTGHNHGNWILPVRRPYRARATGASHTTRKLTVGHGRTKRDRTKSSPHCQLKFCSAKIEGKIELLPLPIRKLGQLQGCFAKVRARLGVGVDELHAVPRKVAIQSRQLARGTPSEETQPALRCGDQEAAELCIEMPRDNARQATPPGFQTYKIK